MEPKLGEQKATVEGDSVLSCDAPLTFGPRKSEGDAAKTEVKEEKVEVKEEVKTEVKDEPMPEVKEAEWCKLRS